MQHRRIVAPTGRDANKKTLTGLLMRTTVSEIIRPDRHVFFARVALSSPWRPPSRSDPAPLSTRRKSISERQRQRVCAIELPRTREHASPLEWQRKIPHTRNRGRVTANDSLRG